MNADKNGTTHKIRLEQEVTEKTENCRNPGHTDSNHGFTRMNTDSIKTVNREVRAAPAYAKYTKRTGAKRFYAKCEPHLPTRINAN